MFTRTSKFDAAIQERDELQFELAERDQTIIHLTRQLESLTAQFHSANATYSAAHAGHMRELRELYERLITAEAEGRKSAALIALWTIRVNQLQHERDQLLARVLPGLDIATPQIRTQGHVFEPQISFEHDPRAADAGDDANNLTPIEDLGGLPGDVYTPDPAAGV